MKLRNGPLYRNALQLYIRITIGSAIDTSTANRNDAPLWFLVMKYNFYILQTMAVESSLKESSLQDLKI